MLYKSVWMLMLGVRPFPIQLMHLFRSVFQLLTDSHTAISSSNQLAQDEQEVSGQMEAVFSTRISHKLHRPFKIIVPGNFRLFLSVFQCV